MPSIVKSLLFKVSPEADTPGRLIRFDGRRPITDLYNGTIRSRIVLFLSLQTSPATVKDIAKGIRSTSGRVSHFLVDLVDDGLVKSLRVKGAPTEFVLLKNEVTPTSSSL